MRKTTLADDGITLVEVLIAFAVLSLALIVTLNATSTGLLLEDRGARQQIALRYASSLLEEAGEAYPLAPGTKSGKTPNGRYSWTVVVVQGPDGVADKNRTFASDSKPMLYSITATITWRDRLAEREVQIAGERLGLPQPLSP